MSERKPPAPKSTTLLAPLAGDGPRAKAITDRVVQLMNANPDQPIKQAKQWAAMLAHARYEDWIEAQRK
jgi:hypothetical protein